MNKIVRQKPTLMRWHCSREMQLEFSVYFDASFGDRRKIAMVSGIKLLTQQSKKLFRNKQILSVLNFITVKTDTL